MSIKENRKDEHRPPPGRNGFYLRRNTFFRQATKLSTSSEISLNFIDELLCRDETPATRRKYKFRHYTKTRSQSFINQSFECTYRLIIYVCHFTQWYIFSVVGF